MASPPRHGARTSNLPVPITEQERREMGPGFRLRPGGQRIVTPEEAVPRSPWGVLPTNALDAFLDSLPVPGFQQISLVDEILWQARNFVTGQVLALNSGYRVPDQVVYVFTDVFFFALTPAADVDGASDYLPEPALNGLIRFQLRFNEVTPMQLEGNLVVPATGTSLGRVGGWPFTNRRFGVERSSGWAVYAKSNQQVQATATIDTMPTFPLTAIGVELRGFSMPDQTFQEKIVKGWRSALPKWR